MDFKEIFETASMAAIHGIERRFVPKDVFHKVRDKQNFSYNSASDSYIETEISLKRRVMQSISDNSTAPTKRGVEHKIFTAFAGDLFVSIVEHDLIDNFEGAGFFKKLFLRIMKTPQYSRLPVQIFIGCDPSFSFDQIQAKEIIKEFMPAPVAFTVTILKGAFRVTKFENGA